MRVIRVQHCAIKIKLKVIKDYSSAFTRVFLNQFGNKDQMIDYDLHVELNKR